MSYLVLARKWRPQDWDEVIGQSHVTGTLRNAIEHNRLAHAYLFTGPRGVGKTSVARILAKALNCESPQGSSPCNTCSSCREITEGGAVDVFEIDGASNRGIDEVRDLREKIRYSPARGRYRIYIIDEVHMLTTQAFNALLKTLEEPPSHALFIFATTEPHKVPATIVSRCQRFDFRRVPSSEIAAREEKFEVQEDALELIARKADGSMRDSQSILDQLVSFSDGAITRDMVMEGLGLIEQGLFFQVTKSVNDRDVHAGMDIIDKVVSGGYDPEEFLLGLAEHLRNLLLVQSTGSTDLVDAGKEDQERYAEAGQTFAEGDLLRYLRLVSEARMELKGNPNPRLPLETALIKMIRLDKTVQIEHLLDLLAPGEGQRAGATQAAAPAKKTGKTKAGDSEKPAEKSEQVTPEAQSASSSQADTSPSENEKKNGITLSQVQARWSEVLERVRRRKITVGSFLHEATLLEVEGEKIELGFGLKNGFHIDAIEKARKLVEEVLSEVYQKPLTFACQKRDLPRREFVPSSKKAKEDLLGQLGKDNPLVKKIIDDFDAEIL